MKERRNKVVTANKLHRNKSGNKIHDFHVRRVRSSFEYFRRNLHKFLLFIIRRASKTLPFFRPRNRLTMSKAMLIIANIFSIRHRRAIKWWLYQYGTQQFAFHSSRDADGGVADAICEKSVWMRFIAIWSALSLSRPLTRRCMCECCNHVNPSKPSVAFDHR